MLLIYGKSSSYNSLCLHPCDLGIGYGKPQASVTHHGIELMEAGDDALDPVDGFAEGEGKLPDIILLLGNELMKRRI